MDMVNYFTGKLREYKIPFEELGFVPKILSSKI